MSNLSSLISDVTAASKAYTECAKYYPGASPSSSSYCVSTNSTVTKSSATAGVGVYSLAALKTTLQAAKKKLANSSNVKSLSEYENKVQLSQKKNDLIKTKIVPPYISKQTPDFEDESKLYAEWSEYGSILFATIAGSLIVYFFVRRAYYPTN